MKQILTLLILTGALIFTTLTAKSQVIVNGCAVTMKESTSDKYLTYENDSVEVSFNPTNTFWIVKLKNKIQNEMVLNWNRSSFIVNGESSKIIFENTINIQRSTPIPNQTIPSDSYITANIYPLTYLEVQLPVISKRFATKRFKETGNPDTVRIVLLFEGNGSKIFNFDITPVKK